METHFTDGYADTYADADTDTDTDKRRHSLTSCCGIVISMCHIAGCMLL